MVLLEQWPAVFCLGWLRDVCETDVYGMWKEWCKILYQYSSWIVNHLGDDWAYATKLPVCVELINFYLNLSKRFLRKHCIVVFLTLWTVGKNIFFLVVGYRRKFRFFYYPSKQWLVLKNWLVWKEDKLPQLLLVLSWWILVFFEISNYKPRFCCHHISFWFVPLHSGVFDG